MSLDNRTLAAIREAAARNVASAPPLTPHQRAVIKAMFAGAPMPPEPEDVDPGGAS